MKRLISLHHDRKASDQKLKEANDILEEINALEEKHNER